jgi:ubiquinone/menaquinone biosynthesis C-methylase UbiE
MFPILIRGWWDRILGRLKPTPCPISMAPVMESRARALVASPDRILEAFHLDRGQRVLEIGPGTGFYSVETARRVGATGFLVCLDIQKDMLIETRARLRQGREKRAVLVQAEATMLPFRPGCFDRVLLIAVLGEIPDRERALAEFGRVLRAGGHLSISEHLPDPDFIPRSALRRLMHRVGLVEVGGHGHLWYTSVWSNPALREAG